MCVFVEIDWFLCSFIYTNKAKSNRIQEIVIKWQRWMKKHIAHYNSYEINESNNDDDDNDDSQYNKSVPFVHLSIVDSRFLLSPAHIRKEVKTLHLHSHDVFMILMVFSLCVCVLANNFSFSSFYSICFVWLGVEIYKLDFWYASFIQIHRVKICLCVFRIPCKNTKKWKRERRTDENLK